MSYDYVKHAYGVDPVPGHRVRLEGPGEREGVIVRLGAKAAHYVHVRFDGSDRPSPCHPTSLEYLGKPAFALKTGASL